MKSVKDGILVIWWIRKLIKFRNAYRNFASSNVNKNFQKAGICAVEFQNMRYDS